MNSVPLTRFDNLVVVLDPRAPDGGSSVALASSLVGDEGLLHLAVPVNGPDAWPFVAFAESEGVGINEAARRFLAQVAMRLDRPRVELEAIDGTELVADLALLVAARGADAVVIPSDMAASILATKRSWGAAPFPVVVAPAAPAAA